MKKDCFNFFSMTRKICCFLVIFLLVQAFNIKAQDKQPQDSPYVILFSMDGFRWDYPEKYAVGSIKYMAQNGVKADSLKPCFPSKTFPNHYSIATGLYPDHHGIVNNEFYDPLLKKQYSSTNEKAVSNGIFYGGEPIWVTAEKQGIKTASFYWVGSEAAIEGIRPAYWKKFNDKFPFSAQFDTVISWLKLPAKQRPHLILCYFPEPDHSSHLFGRESKEVKLAVHELDSLFCDFFRKSQKLPIGKKINIIVLSDHGMSATSPERYTDLSQYVKKDWCALIESGDPIVNLQAKPGFADSLFNGLSKAPHVKIWKNRDIPAKFNYGKNARELSMTLLADSSWTFGLGTPGKLLGNHGYDNDNKDMQAIFYACGPAFKKGYKQPGFINIDVYPLIAEIMRLKPTKIDG